MNPENILQIGQIRHPKGLPKSLMKCLGPFENESSDNDGLSKFKLYLPLTKVPKFHYFIIIELIKNYIDPDYNYCLVRLITHSGDKFNNLKITCGLYDSAETKIDFSNSYISKDKFLILIDNINLNKIYGSIDIFKLNIALNN